MYTTCLCGPVLFATTAAIATALHTSGYLRGPLEASEYVLYIYIYIHTNTYVYIYIYIYTHTYIRICVYNIYIYIYICHITLYYYIRYRVV